MGGISGAADSIQRDEARLTLIRRCALHFDHDLGAVLWIVNAVMVNRPGDLLHQEIASPVDFRIGTSFHDPDLVSPPWKDWKIKLTNLVNSAVERLPAFN